MNTAPDAAAPRARWNLAALAPFLAVQAFLLFHQLGLLPVWCDEVFTLRAIPRSPGEIVGIAAGDIHPPLYFLLAHFWAMLPLPGDALERARALSGFFALATTLAVDRLFLARRRQATRIGFLALWTLSPYLLLYGRMARSYTMQGFAAVLCVSALLLLAAEPPRRRNVVLACASLLFALYTHYLPGVALWVAMNALLAQRIRSGNLARPASALLIPNAIVALGYAPWLLTLWGAVRRWTEHSGVYRLSGSGWTEPFVGAGYWLWSSVFGEVMPLWIFAAGAALAVPCLILFCDGMRGRPPWRLVFLAMAALGFAGAERWVSYVFIPARLLFLLPFVLLALLLGAERRRFGMAVCCALGVVYAGACWSYFHGNSLLNSGYAAPYPEIVQNIFGHSRAATPVLVWIDGKNVDGDALHYYLRQGARVRVIDSRAAAERALADLDDPSVARVWFLRHAHDLTPGQSCAWLEHAAAARWPGTLHPYLPFTPTLKTLLAASAPFGAVRVAGPPYALRLWEFRRGGRKRE